MTRQLTATYVEYDSDGLAVAMPAGPGEHLVTSGEWQPATALTGYGAGGAPIPGIADVYGIPLGVLGRDYFIYAPPGSIAYIRVFFIGATGGTGTLNATIQTWDGRPEGDKRTVSLAASGSAAEFAWHGYLTGTYHRIDKIEVGPTHGVTGTPTGLKATFGWVTGGVRAAPSGTLNPLIPVASPPQLAVSKAQFVDTRVTALAVKVINTTKVLNKEGTVNAARLDLRQVASDQVWALADSVFAGVHPSMRYFGALEHGLYSYFQPTAEAASFSNCLLADTSFIVMDLAALPVVQAAVFTDPDSGTNLAAAVDWHIEFRTTSTLFPIATCTSPIEQYHRAAIAVSRTCPFTAAARAGATGATQAPAQRQRRPVRPRKPRRPRRLPPAGFEQRTLPPFKTEVQARRTSSNKSRRGSRKKMVIKV